jgi:hypothetical protein
MKMAVTLVPVIAVLSFAASATANVIGFGGLTPPNGDPFSSYVENGFTVTAIQGSWSKAFIFGNPIPDINCFLCAPGAVSITAFGAPFTFQSVDLGNGESSIDSFTIQGFRLGAMVLSQSGMLTLPNAFQTFASINPSVPIDDLIISLTSGASLFDYNIDNIAVNPVAEPGTAASAIIALTVALPFRKIRLKGFARKARKIG